MEKLPSPPQRWNFPDGSTYFGDGCNGFMDMTGEGELTDATGNRYVGSFEAGAYEGPGTIFGADGRAEVWRFHAGTGVGEGALWSAGREKAWQLYADADGAVTRRQVDLQAAAAIADGLGLPVPRCILARDDGEQGLGPVCVRCSAQVQK